MATESEGFQQFRRSRSIQKLEERMRDRMATAREEIARQIACSEAAEEIEKRVILEMRDFFTEATRLAAQVLAEIHRRRAEALDARLEDEIDTFFEETKVHAIKALDEARSKTISEVQSK